MLIDVKYEVGDHINFLADTIYNTIREKCGFCNGTGKIQGNDHTIMICPKCNGKRTLPKIEYSVVEDAIIENIDVSYNTHNNAGVRVTYYTSKGGTLAENVVED